MIAVELSFRRNSFLLYPISPKLVCFMRLGSGELYGLAIFNFGIDITFSTRPVRFGNKPDRSNPQI
jgi:hypothetical protein